MKKTKEQIRQQVKFWNELVDGKIKAWEYSKGINKIFGQQVFKVDKPVKK